MVQEKYLTPPEIFSTLKIFEKKIALKKYEEYQPRYINQELSDESLNKEVASMLLFAGILGYQSQCFWDTLPDDKGGDFRSVGETSIRIRVSDRYKNNRPALLATLAHEVCHAVLYNHKIAQKDTQENEYCTDLCTIYLGFGRLIINGYNTYREGVNHQLGYLKYDIYQQTYNLINVARNTGIPLIDCCDNLYLKDTLVEWSKAPDKEALLRRKIVDSEMDVAYLLSTRRCLDEIITQIVNRPINQYRMRKLSETYDECCALGNMATNYPIHGIAALYESMFYDSEDEELEELRKISRVMGRAINNICNLTPDLKHQNTYVKSECPHCGETISETERNTSIVKCHKCQRSFYAGVQGYLVKSICDTATYETSRAKEEQCKKIDEAYERGRRKGVESNAATAYQRGYNEAQKKYEKLPRWLQWLVARYV